MLLTFTVHVIFLLASMDLEQSHPFYHLILTTILQSRHWPHSKDETTKAQRSGKLAQVIRLQQLSWVHDSRSHLLPYL